MGQSREVVERPLPARDVFVSYAGPDRGLAAALVASLEAAQVGTWWDGKLSLDEPFEHQIQRVLAETKVIVAIVSPHALASEWVRWELSQASQNGLHVVPVLLNGVRPEQLPPPLDLLPRLSPVDGDGSEFMQVIARQIGGLIERMNRRPSGQKENDARRRLASAAARTARQAAEIKYRKTRTAPRPPIVVGEFEDGSRSDSSPVPYSMSEGLVSFLRDESIAIAFTCFQTGELFLVGHTPAGQLMVHVQDFRKPTGLHVAGGALLVATLAHVYRLENILRAGQRLDGVYSHCYVPRLGHFTGVLDAHDVGVTREGEPLFVATRYNCLATLSSTHSFKPVWRPPFISEIVAEDRCHLNGLAMHDGAGAYVTAVGRADDYDGWRDHAASGGIVLDVNSNATICGGLSMPHSPRVHDGLLWLLNSGCGELGYVDGAETGVGRFRPIAFCPGFVRGLAFHGRHALVGLSRPRYDDFAGLDLHNRLALADQEAWCGVQIIDTTSGECVHWFRIDGPAREIYDVAVLPDVSCPRSVSCLGDEAFDLITVEDEANRSRAKVGSS
jgi:uncharacterized protein (TIGR03032 family)